MELRAMGPTIARGPMDPPQTLYAVKAKLRHAFEVGITGNTLTNVTDGTLCASLPGGSGWSSFRILKVSAYFPGLAGVVATINQFVALAMPGDATYLDGNTQVFTDHGVPGARSPNVHVTPAFAQRTRWYPYNATGSTELFQVAGSFLGTGSSILVHVTLELQSTIQTPAYLT